MQYLYTRNKDCLMQSGSMETTHAQQKFQILQNIWCRYRQYRACGGVLHINAAGIKIDNHRKEYTSGIYIREGIQLHAITANAINLTMDSSWVVLIC